MEYIGKSEFISLLFKHLFDSNLFDEMSCKNMPSSLLFEFNTKYVGKSNWIRFLINKEDSINCVMITYQINSECIVNQMFTIPNAISLIQKIEKDGFSK